MKVWRSIGFVLAVMALASRVAANEPDAATANIKEAKAFLAGVYALDARKAESVVKARIRVGDPVSKHRWILAETMEITLNPYSDRFVCKFYEGGKAQDPGGQGYWTLTIEVDAKHTIARVEIGIARQ